MITRQEIERRTYGKSPNERFDWYMEALITKLEAMESKEKIPLLTAIGKDIIDTYGKENALEAATRKYYERISLRDMANLYDIIKMKCK